MNVAATFSDPAVALQAARQCAVLLDIICNDLGGDCSDSREPEMVMLAASLAQRAHAYFGNARGKCDAHHNDGADYAGVLDASLFALGMVTDRFQLTEDRQERAALVDRISWLQWGAKRYAERATQELEAICASL